MNERRHSFDTVIGLFLVCLFAASLFFVLSIGVGIYSDIESVMAEQFSTRTASAYVVSRVRQADRIGGIELGTLGDTDALILYEDLGDEQYLTYIYYYDGYIMELYCDALAELSPADGERVLKTDSLSFSMNGPLLRIDCSHGDNSSVEYVHITAGAKGGGE